MKEIGIGLLGLGNVGGGVVRILDSHAAEIEARLGARLRVRRVAVRDLDRRRDIPVDPALLTKDLDAVLGDPSIAVVVELIGGTTDARRAVLEAIERGKHVVTANKALLAEHGEEIFSRARARGVDVFYEGAVCGGLPILRTIREALAADRIDGLFGIVNGTTNYILTQMSEHGTDFATALKGAQEKGYAEADPTLDISGGDAAQKLCILAALAFGARVHPADVPTEGITELETTDFAAAREFGYVIKLLAIARRVGDGIEARVHPTMIPAASLLADVRGAFNAVLLQADALGPAMFYGKGAGGMATGSAVVSDLIDLCRNLLAESPGRVPMPCEPWIKDAPRPSADELRCPYYLRFTVDDQPGVLARICGVLAERNISIGSVVQRERRGADEAATVIIVTHEAREGDVRAALNWIDGLGTTRARTRLIRIHAGAPLVGEL
ncbi:MAG: homoserine dehydrogenase [Myxococcales bacterium]